MKRRCGCHSDVLVFGHTDCGLRTEWQPSLELVAKRVRELIRIIERANRATGLAP